MLPQHPHLAVWRSRSDGVDGASSGLSTALGETNPDANANRNRHNPSPQGHRANPAAQTAPRRRSRPNPPSGYPKRQSTSLFKHHPHQQWQRDQRPTQRAGSQQRDYLPAPSLRRPVATAFTTIGRYWPAQRLRNLIDGTLTRIPRKGLASLPHQAAHTSTAPGWPRQNPSTQARRPRFRSPTAQAAFSAIFSQVREA